MACTPGRLDILFTVFLLLRSVPSAQFALGFRLLRYLLRAWFLQRASQKAELRIILRFFVDAREKREKEATLKQMTLSSVAITTSRILRALRVSTIMWKNENPLTKRARFTRAIRERYVRGSNAVWILSDLKSRIAYRRCMRKRVFVEISYSSRRSFRSVDIISDYFALDRACNLSETASLFFFFLNSLRSRYGRNIKVRITQMRRPVNVSVTIHESAALASHAADANIYMMRRQDVFAGARDI